MTLTRYNNGDTIDAAVVNQYFDLHKGGLVFDLINGYGCDPTGVTECSVKVNQAFTDAAASGKSAMVTGYGTLLVNQTVKCSSDNIALVGQGAGHPDHMLNGLRFKAASSFTGTRIVDFSTTSKPLSGVLMQNVSVDGNNHTGTGLDGIYFSAHDSLMDFCHVTYCTGWGIRVAGVNPTNAPPLGWTCYNTLVRACRVRACDLGGFLFDDYSTDTHDNECWAFYCGLTDIAGSTLRTNNADGMRLKSSGHQSYGYHAYSNTGHGFVTEGVSASQMTAAYLENNGKAGFYADNAVSGASGFRLSNSYIWANSTLSPTGSWSNVQIGSGGSGVSMIITGNRIDAGTNSFKPLYGIDLPNSVAQDCLVSNNQVFGTYSAGGKPIHSNGSGGYNGISSSTVGTECIVTNNSGHNPVGESVAGIGFRPGIPTSTFATTPNNCFNEPATVYLLAGTGAVTVALGPGNAAGTTIMVIPAATTGTFRVMPGWQVKLTYSGSPSWLWFLD